MVKPLMILQTAVATAYQACHILVAKLLASRATADLATGNPSLVVQAMAFLAYPVVVYLATVYLASAGPCAAAFQATVDPVEALLSLAYLVTATLAAGNPVSAPAHY